jgi:hypothetical protein
MMATGCATVESTFTESIPAETVSTIVVDIEKGDFTYQGMRTDLIDIQGRSYGHGTSEDRAEERQDGTLWNIGLQGTELQLLGRTDAYLAGVDFDVMGPMALNTVILVEDGSASVDNLYGNILVQAERISATNLAGSVDLTATFGDLYAELTPVSGEHIRVDARDGDVDLWLPWGLDYDLQVWGDPGYEMIVADLGFGWTTAAPGYFAGQAGSARTKVDVYASGGAVRIHTYW